ncbi:MAG: hypothetical protein HXX18_11630 [Bacteroidetes bacterium]|nr:hypothetical protein [Bacteroidota bacterium]
MELKIARIISYIFHPLLMPFYTFIILFNMKIFFASILTVEYKLMILTFILVSTFLFPAILTYILLRKKSISSLHLEKREERTIPFLFTIVFYYGTYHIMKNAEVPAIYLLLMLASTFIIIMAFLINFKFKISVHTIAVGALTGILIGISYRFNINLLLPIFMLIIIAGLVSFSRLALNAHRPAEVYIGYLMGFCFMLGLFILG